MAVACASLAVAGRWEIGGLFTEAELAVADQLVQLSGSGGGDEEAASSESPRSVNTCAGAAAWEDQREEAAAGPGLGAMELDRRARKRYRLLSDVYAATRPVAGAGAGADNARKRKRGHEPTEAEPRRRGRRSGRYDDGDQCF